jgi:hypothetical protein
LLTPPANGSTPLTSGFKAGLEVHVTPHWRSGTLKNWKESPFTAGFDDVGTPLLHRFSLLLLSGLLAAALSGCAGYRLGPTNGLEAGERSIQVNAFANQTIEPRLVAPVTTSIRKQLQRDGTYRLNTSNDGDIIVTGNILEYDRSSLSFQPRDIVTPRDYHITIVAHVTARDRHSGKVVLDRRVAGHTTVRVGNDLNSAERQAIPLLADDLARNVTSLLVDGEW